MYYTVPPGVQVGHIHLSVSDLERSIRFYAGILGFSITQRIETVACFLSAVGYHHHIGLNTWGTLGSKPAPPGFAGLYHVAFKYPDRKSIAAIVSRLLQLNYPFEGTADHGVSEAVYLRDPDGNGVELYCDRPENQWPRDITGGLAMFTHRLDLPAC